MLCGAGPQDEGSYLCQVSAGSESCTTRACEVKLSVAEAARRARIEAPLRRAAEAEGRGEKEAALGLLTEAIAAAADGNEESLRAEALCRRAELLQGLGRWEEALRDGAEAVRASPGLARAHAARGAAALKLGHLAEAASSWETAELLGGVPVAAREAEACRQRLQEFFAERQAKLDEAGPKANFVGGGEPGRGGRNVGDNEEEDGGEEGPEAAWRRSGWQGRYAGGAAGGFFGRGSGSAGGPGRGRGHGSSGSSGYGGRAAPSPPELQLHLRALGLATDARGALPSAEVVRGAYRRLALQAHPDKPGGSKTAFQELQNAYEAVLSAAAAAA